MCCCFVFIHLFLLADNTEIDLNDIYTSLQKLTCQSRYSLLEQTTPTQPTRIAAASPLQFQTVQPTTEPLHLVGHINQPLLQTNLTPQILTNPSLQLHQTNLVPCVQANPISQLQTNPTPKTPQLQTNSIPQLIKTPQDHQPAADPTTQLLLPNLQGGTSPTNPYTRTTEVFPVTVNYSYPIKPANRSTSNFQKI